MDLPLVYHADYSFSFPSAHRFPMDKFVRLHDHLRAQAVLCDSNLYSPQICTPELLTLAHDAGYVERFCYNDLARDELRRMGLPWSEALVQRTTRAVGGSLLTADLALQHGLACHLAGGTHHAHHGFRLGILYLQRSGNHQPFPSAKREGSARADFRLRCASGRWHGPHIGRR